MPSWLVRIRLMPSRSNRALAAMRLARSRGLSIDGVSAPKNASNSPVICRAPALSKAIPP